MPLEVVAHRYVAFLAEKLAEDAWEQLMLDNATYAVNRENFAQRRQYFVRTTAPTLRVRARQILGAMLARPDVPEAAKEEIWEALTLDRTLPTGGTSYGPR